MLGLGSKMKCPRCETTEFPKESILIKRSESVRSSGEQDREIYNFNLEEGESEEKLILETQCYCSKKIKYRIKPKSEEDTPCPNCNCIFAEFDEIEKYKKGSKYNKYNDREIFFLKFECIACEIKLFRDFEIIEKLDS